MEDIIIINKKADKSLGILTSLYIMSILANLTIGYRYISILNLDEAGGIFIFPLSFMISDIIAERYDTSYAKMLIWCGVMCQLIFSLYIYLIIRMPHPGFWNSSEIFFQVMNPYLRFTLASSGAVILGSWLNIHFLSKWSGMVQGKYFALRSLGSSFIGELFVTVFSMLIANYGRMESKQLVWMMSCCFFIKTIVSIIAVWPAAFIVYLLKNQEEKFFEYEGLGFLSKLMQFFKYFSKPSFRLDEINTKKNTVNIYCRGGRTIIIKNISDVILNKKIIYNMHPTQSSMLGFHFGLLDEKNNNINELLSKRKNSMFSLRFKKSKYTFLCVTREGDIYYQDNFTQEIIIKTPEDIYRAESIIKHFESTQACYIGILAAKSQKKYSSNQKPNISRLKLISND